MPTILNSKPSPLWRRILNINSKVSLVANIIWNIQEYMRTCPGGWLASRRGDTSLSNPLVSRDGNKMWNCKLCVGKIGPRAVVLWSFGRIHIYWEKEARVCRREVEDLNVQPSKNRRGNGKWLEICYVSSDYHSLVNMKKEFFGISVRDGGWGIRFWAFLWWTNGVRTHIVKLWGWIRKGWHYTVPGI